MEKTVGIITMEKVENRKINSVGSSRIRARWLLNYWPEAEEWTMGRKYDVVIFQKAYFKKLAEEFKGIKIFDICDPDWLDPRPVFEMISYCDAVTVPTQPLADFLKKMTKKPVYIIPDRVNLDEIKYVKFEHKGKAKNAVWFGYSSNLKYITRTFDFLHGKGLSLTLISDEQLDHLETPLQYRFIKYRYETINEEVIKADFVLMPDTADPDGRLKYKSNNKIIQSWAWGMPVAKTPDEINRFMDGEERQKESEARLKEVAEKYDVRLSVEEYRKVINTIKK